MEVELKSNDVNLDNGLFLSDFSKDKSIIEYGDTILIMESKDSFKPIKVEKDGITQNKFGHFLHSEFIGKQVGGKVRSYSKHKNDKIGFITIVGLIPSIWDKAGERLTQIIFSPDISMILTMLDIQSDYIVMESGTGSGCLSLNIANVLSTGHLYTFEFNYERATKLKQHFSNINVGDRITVTNQDVLEHGFNISKNSVRQQDYEKYKNHININKIEETESNCLNGVVDALFIDLPCPWAVVKAAKSKLKENGCFVSFSPCIEQVDKTMVEMRKEGFIHPRMFEVCYRGYNYVKSEKLRVPQNFDRNNGIYIEEGQCFEYKYEDILVDTSRDMRGHTGYLTIAVKGYDTSYTN